MRRVIRKYEAKVTLPPPDSGHRAPPYTTEKAEADYEAGEDYSFMNFVGMHGDGMLSQVDLPRLGTDFAIPVYFVEGAHDLLAPPEMARHYYESIRAPDKGWCFWSTPGSIRIRRWWMRSTSCCVRRCCHCRDRSDAFSDRIGHR